MDPKDRIVLALDFESFLDARKTVEQVRQYIDSFKIPPNLIYALGFDAIADYLAMKVDSFSRKKLFIDIKSHDTPNTVRLTVSGLAKRNAGMVTVHASAGVRAVNAAVSVKQDTKIYAVTLLTSLDQHDLPQDSHGLLERLALIAGACGVDGVVCSAHHIPFLKTILGEDCEYISPGIAYEEEIPSGQSIVTTPTKAIELGATKIVVGRAVIQSKLGSPEEMAERVLIDVTEASEKKEA